MIMSWTCYQAFNKYANLLKDIEESENEEVMVKQNDRTTNEVRSTFVSD